MQTIEQIKNGSLNLDIEVVPLSLRGACPYLEKDLDYTCPKIWKYFPGDKTLPLRNGENLKKEQKDIFLNPLSTLEKDFAEFFTGSSDNKPGLIRGTTSIISAGAGVGKSRIAVLLSFLSAAADQKVLYFSCEEDPSQFVKWPIVKELAKRYPDYVKNIYVDNATNVDKHIKLITSHKPDLVIVDSVNVLSDLKPSTLEDIFLHKYKKTAAKEKCHILFLNQVNCDNSPKGGTTIPHLVDTHLVLERTDSMDLSNEHFPNYPKGGCLILKSVKNRYAPSLKPLRFRHSDTGEFWGNQDRLNDIRVIIISIYREYVIEALNKKTQESQSINKKNKKRESDRVPFWKFVKTRFKDPYFRNS